MEKDLKHTIASLDIPLNTHFLIAVSGGVDSMVLLDLFCSMKLKISVAHCNFGLRGAHSDLDQQLVEKICAKHQIPCFVKQINLDSYKTEHQVSTQMAARELRYSWFSDLMSEGNGELLATAHHLDDSIETMFLNLSRGTGIEGLKGIRSLSNQVVRPLIHVSKEEIREYANENIVEFREDVSNSSNAYKRNKIRNEILPIFKEINPTFSKTMASNLSHISEALEFYNSVMEEKKKAICILENEVLQINIEQLIHSESNRLLLFEILKEFGFDRSQTDKLFALLRTEFSVGKEFFTASHRLLVDRAIIFVKEIEETKNETFILNNENKFVTFDLELTFNQIPIGEIDLLTESHIAFLDADKIKYPLYLRKWKEGDKFRPLGMLGKKKVSDFLIDKKLSRIEKEKTWVLLSEEKIFWIVGHRIDNSFKLTDSTKTVLKITFESK